MVSEAIKPAIRKASRLHEIGNDTPYRISFAAKGKSGGSFGFMQGDLAAGQPNVLATFRNAMTAAGMSASEINDLVALLSKHQITNPLSAAQTSRVDQALRASSRLVDQMDEKILQDVYDDLDTCLSHAARHARKIDTKALVYIALWINMSGPPTKLLTWLDGGDPHLVREVPPAGSVVQGDAMEDYLAATSYYTQNPRNLAHIRECAAAGMRELGDATVILAFPMESPMEAPFGADTEAATMRAAPPASTVTIAAKASDGRDYTVSIQKTGNDTGTLSLRESGGSPKSFDVTNIRARADGTKLVCHATVGATIACSLRAGRESNSDSIEIAVTDTLFGLGNGVTSYTVAQPDFARLKGFIAQAGFPALSPAPSSTRAASTMSAQTESMAITEAGPAPADAAPAPPSSGFTQNAVRIATEQWNRFGQQTYDITGRTTHHGHKEGEDPWYRYVAQFWSEGVHDETLTGRDDVPWSAAFISWVMQASGAGTRFNYSPQHSVYISRAIRDLRQARAQAGYWCYRLNEERPQPGDIVCWARQAGIDYDHQNGGDYKGHCDVIIAVGAGGIEIIGGNVGNSVTRRPLALNPNGTIKPVVQGGETLFGLMKCRI